MVIKVNTSELQGKSSYAKSIASRLGEEASQINRLYYNVDPKVRDRQGIGSSMKSLQQRLERAQRKMYNISSFLAVAAAQYSDAESTIIARLNGLDAIRATSGDFTSGVGEGKKWYNSNIFKIAVGVVIIGVAVAAVVLTGGAAIAVGAAVGAGIGALGGGVVGGVVSKVHGGNFMDGFADGFMAGAIGGAVSGAVGATGVGFWGAAAIDGGTDSLIYAVQTLQNDGQVTIGGLATSFVVGMGISAISSGISSRIRNKGGSQTNKYCLNGEEHYENLKALFGEDNVEWTSKNTISNYERLKLSGWERPPKDELYLKYKDIYNNDLYYNQATGKINWPKNNGFIEEFPGYETLDSSMLLDRYGESTGNFFAQATDAYETRALAPHSETSNHYYYRPLQKFEVTSGKVAPWFGSTGGAKQYIKYHENGKLYTIDELIDEGLIEDVTDLIKEGLIK